MLNNHSKKAEIKVIYSLYNKIKYSQENKIYLEKCCLILEFFTEKIYYFKKNYNN